MGRHLDGDDDFDEYDTKSHDSSSIITTTTDSDSTLFSTTIPQSSKGSNNSTYNTGPKGVRSDARAYQSSQTELRKSQEMAASASAAATIQNSSATTWSQDKAELDARERWVEKRMKELSKASSSQSAAPSSSKGIEEVDAAGYLTLIEAQPYVVVVIFSDEADQESEFIELLASVAVGYYGIRWCKLHCNDAEMDSVACPAILVYQDGNLVVNAMRVLDGLESSGDMSSRSVERKLVDLGVLKQQYRIDEDLSGGKSRTR